MKKRNDQPLFQITKDELLESLNRAMARYKLVALKCDQEKVLYDVVSNTEDIVWEYQPTVLPPKKFFFPPDETILEYTDSGEVCSKMEAEPLLLFGIRPCDINAVKILHEAFAEIHGDPNYLEKEQKTVIIGMDCKSICDEKAFCYHTQSQDALAGCDLMLYDLGESYLLRPVTEKGGAFVTDYFETEQGSKAAFKKYRKDKESTFAAVGKPFKNLDQFPAIFERNNDHFIWKEEGARCLSCASCVMVCPTCYCFDVLDEWELNLKKGTRVRQWDACMRSDFTLVAGDETFRDKKEDRLRHRINRKFNFLMKKHGQSACVGCGRCERACLADISPKSIAKVLSTA